MLVHLSTIVVRLSLISFYNYSTRKFILANIKKIIESTHIHIFCSMYITKLVLEKKIQFIKTIANPDKIYFTHKTTNILFIYLVILIK